MVPVAPSRFTTTTRRPRISVSASATPRPTASTPPPAAKGTISSMPRPGQVWAAAGAASSGARASRRRRRMVRTLFVDDGHGPRPSAGAAVHLHREARHLEAIGGQHLQVVRLLDVGVADLPPRAVAFPDQVGRAAL